MISLTIFCFAIVSTRNAHIAHIPDSKVMLAQRKPNRWLNHPQRWANVESSFYFIDSMSTQHGNANI